MSFLINKTWALLIFMLAFYFQSAQAAHSNINMDWQVDPSGTTLRFTILSSTQGNMSPNEVLNCGGILSAPQCQIALVPGGLALTPSYIYTVPLKNRQSYNAIIDSRAQMLPQSGAILNWDK